MKFGQLKEYNQRNIFLQKSYRKLGRVTLVELYKSFQFLIFKPPSYCFEKTVSLTSSVAYNQARRYNKKKLRKGYSVPWNFSYI